MDKPHYCLMTLRGLHALMEGKFRCPDFTNTGFVTRWLGVKTVTYIRSSPMCQWFFHFCRRCWINSIPHPPSKFTRQTWWLSMPLLLVDRWAEIVQWFYFYKLKSPASSYSSTLGLTYHTKGPERPPVWTIAIHKPLLLAASTGVGQASRIPAGPLHQPGLPGIRALRLQGCPETKAGLCT